MMKVSLAVFIGSTVSWISTFAIAVECGAEFRMTSDQIGPIKLEMTEEEVITASSEYAAEKIEYWSEMDGADYVQYLIRFCGDNSIVAEFYNGSTIHTLETSSSLIMTEEGAYIGMAATQLQAIYPDAKFVNAWNEGLHRFFVVDDGNHGVFEFGPGRCELGMSDTVSSDCNKVLPEDRSVKYWTNSAYTKPGIW
jgi:hypothetical protein